ncbi:hypothetical protein [Nocardioides aurantiacus]|uniref:hypothetical protein n=1 Tax=Nocardioides aurantiacus TaxID=86796 RepID=UPI00403F730A
MSRTTHAGARAALLLLALLGLLAMHGLAAHGTAGHHGATAPLAAPLAAHGPAHHAAPTAAADLLAPATPLAPAGDPTAGAGLCLAVLLLGLVALLALRRTGGLPLLLRSPVLLPPLMPPARDPDPPDLSRLCVLRC